MTTPVSRNYSDRTTQGIYLDTFLCVSNIVNFAIPYIQEHLPSATAMDLTLRVRTLMAIVESAISTGAIDMDLGDDKIASLRQMLPTFALSLGRIALGALVQKDPRLSALVVAVKAYSTYSVVSRAFSELSKTYAKAQKTKDFFNWDVVSKTLVHSINSSCSIYSTAKALDSSLGYFFPPPPNPVKESYSSIAPEAREIIQKKANEVATNIASQTGLEQKLQLFSNLENIKKTLTEDEIQKLASGTENPSEIEAGIRGFISSNDPGAEKFLAERTDIFNKALQKTLCPGDENNEALKKCYRTLSKRIHPDQTTGTGLDKSVRDKAFTEFTNIFDTTSSKDPIKTKLDILQDLPEAELQLGIIPSKGFYFSTTPGFSNTLEEVAPGLIDRLGNQPTVPYYDSTKLFGTIRSHFRPTFEFIDERKRQTQGSVLQAIKERDDCLAHTQEDEPQCTEAENKLSETKDAHQKVLNAEANVKSLYDTINNLFFQINGLIPPSFHTPHLW